MTNSRDIKIEDYNYPLPDGRIAIHPLAQRDECKLLIYRDGEISDLIFRQLPSVMPERAMLVYNNTRVINARLRFAKATGAAIEIFCLEPHTPADYEQAFSSRGECQWQCLVGNSKKWKDGLLESRHSGGKHCPECRPDATACRAGQVADNPVLVG